MTNSNSAFNHAKLRLVRSPAEIARREFWESRAALQRHEALKEEAASGPAPRDFARPARYPSWVERSDG